MIFTFLIVLVFLFRLLFFRLKNNGKKLYCITIALLLILVSGLRSMYVGIDSLSYVNEYLNSIYSFNYDTFLSVIRSEILYKKFVVFCRWIGANYTIFFTIIACFYSVVMGRFVYKNSKEPAMSFLMLLSMGYFFFSMTGLRQTIAICFIILAIEKLLNKETKLFILLTCIASMFHISAIITFLLLVINKLELNIKYVLGIGILTIIAYGFAPSIIEYFQSVFWPTKAYNVEEYGGISTFILLILIASAAFILQRKPIINKSLTAADQLYFKMIIFSIPIQLLAIHQANAFRAAMYFHIISIILVTNIIMKVKDKQIRKISYVVICALLLVQFYVFTYHSAGIIPYTFFWEV